MSSKSIFRQYNAARTSRLVTSFDGVTGSVYSNLAVGSVSGAHRQALALVSATATDNDVWRVVNLKSIENSTSRFDSVAVLGAIDSDQATEWAMKQHGQFLLDSAVVSVAETNAPGLMRYLNSKDFNYVANAPIHAERLRSLQDVTTAEKTMWDGINLKSHGGQSSTLLLDLVKHDDHGQLFDAIRCDDMPAMLEALGAEFMAYDSLIVESRMLEKLTQRLSTAMSRATEKGVTVVNSRQSEPFKRNKVTQIMAIFEMSDGQSVSIVFHNPDSTPSKLLPQDTLISWKFMLNTRDISAAVQPNQGEDVQLPVLATRIMKLVNQNSARFQRTAAKKTENLQELENAKGRIETKTMAIADLDAEIARLQAELDKPVAVVPAADPYNGQYKEQDELEDAANKAILESGVNAPLHLAKMEINIQSDGRDFYHGDSQYVLSVHQSGDGSRLLKSYQSGRKPMSDWFLGDVAALENAFRNNGFVVVDKSGKVKPIAPQPTPAVVPAPFSQYRPNFDKIAKVLTENFGWSYETSDNRKITKDFVMGLDGKKQAVIAYQYEYDLLAIRSTDDKQLASINLTQDQYLDTLAKVRSSAGEFDARIQEVEDNWLAEAKTAQDAADTPTLTTQQRNEQAFEGVKAVLTKDYGWSPRGNAPLKKAFEGAQESGSLNPSGTLYVSAYPETVNLTASVGNGMDDPKRIAFGQLPQYNLNQASYERVARLFNRDVENYIDARRRELQKKPAVEPTLTKTDMGNGESLVEGMAENRDGTFTALTLVDSKTFKTRAGAVRWLAVRGLNPDGTQMAKPEPAVEPEIKPAYLPKPDGTDAGEYIQEWGEYQFDDKSDAANYAKRLEMGEGGKWRVEQLFKSGKWRAHRVESYDQPTYMQWDNALTSIYKMASEKGIKSLVDYYGYMTVADVMKAHKTPADFLRDAAKVIASGTAPAAAPTPTPEESPMPTTSPDAEYLNSVISGQTPLATLADIKAVQAELKRMDAELEDNPNDELDDLVGQAFDLVKTAAKKAMQAAA